MGTDPPDRMIRTGRTGRRRGGISSRAGTGRDSVEFVGQAAIPREASSGGNPGSAARSFTLLGGEGWFDPRNGEFTYRGATLIYEYATGL